MSDSAHSLLDRVYAAEAEEFGQRALEVYAYQARANATYAAWLSLIGKTSFAPAHWTEIPCLPIELWRSQDMRSGSWTADTEFVSSGTTGHLTSRMPVRNLAAYQAHAKATFERRYGPLSQYRLLALLPHYLEQGASGLVAMIDGFMGEAAAGSGYFLRNEDALVAQLEEARAQQQPVLLWGVTYALLALAQRPDELVLPQGSVLIETGGMKGHGPELTRNHLHKMLEPRFGVIVGSEYGMTEMSSQAYLQDNGRFYGASSLRVRTRDLSDPLTLLRPGSQGAINVYDLANVDTCAFVQTDDLGRYYADDGFMVLGRVDQSLVRGCNLLI